MKKLFLLLTVLVFGMGIATASDQSTDSSMVGAQELVDGQWNQIKPGGETTCARGTDYSFFVRPGDSEKLMIHFQGGGACWNGVNCSAGPLQTFDDTVSDDESAQFAAGVFDVENEQNPVKDYTQVVVSYCTADVHIGDTTTDYDTVEIEHNGIDNAQAVLDWVYENYPDPENVFVNGCSAGSYGSIYFAPTIAEHYANAAFVHLGDAGIGAAPQGWAGLESWGAFEAVTDYFPELGDFTAATWDTNTFYEAAAARIPEGMFSQFTTIADEVQIAFFGLQGGELDQWAPLAQEKLQALDVLDNFASYTGPGDIHCIIPRPEMYSMESNGVNFVDWLTALVNGEMVETISVE